LRQVLTVPAARAAAERLALRVPALGTVLRDFLLVEVFTLMSSLTAAGFTLQRSLDLAAQVTSSRNLAEALREVSSSLNEGLLLSEAFERRQDLFTALGVHMIAVGESTGRLQDMFSTLAGYYLVEVEFALDSLPAILEPVLMATVGVMTGVVVLAVFMPIYQIVSALL
jgi:type II secretory pathway component PulF